MAESILFVTTDQQRYDFLGCNGGSIASTPTIDALAQTGIRYERAHTQNVLCMPSRATMITGQHPGTHGVWTNGVCLGRDAPSVAELLADQGYATALIGKIHFETIGADYAEHLRSSGDEPVEEMVFEHRDGRDMIWLLPGPGASGAHRGFQHLELCNHAVSGHHARWLQDEIGWAAAADLATESARAFLGEVPPGIESDTGAFQAMYSRMPAELHSSHWAVDRALAWIESLPVEQPFFCWLSFDDPHHPFNPPAEYGRRHDWRELPLPAARPRTRAEIEADLAAKPWQYGAYWSGEFALHEGTHVPIPLTEVTDDQVREITALTAGMVELIDDELGRLLAGLAASGRDASTHVVVTADHGELLGDHGLFLKGPFHLDGLLRVPLVWRPAPGCVTGTPVGTTVRDPVGLVDLAPTFCSLAGMEPPEWMEGTPLPAADGARERVLSVYDCAFRDDLALRSLFRDDVLVTMYPRSGGDQPAADPIGELYELGDDPHQRENRWSDPSRRRRRDELVADLADHVVEDARPERLRRWTM